MSLCEFDDDDGISTYRCAREATHLVSVTVDLAGNPPYQLRYCPAHAAYYLEPGRALPEEEFSVAELDIADQQAAYVVARLDGDDDDL